MRVFQNQKGLLFLMKTTFSVSRTVPKVLRGPSILAKRFVSANKPGTAQVGAISKAQKDSKTTFSTTGDSKSCQKKTKNLGVFKKLRTEFFEIYAIYLFYAISALKIGTYRRVGE